MKYKFRMWDNKRSRMVYDQRIEIWEDPTDQSCKWESGKAPCGAITYYIIPEDGSILMQWSGFKDASRKDIYEGDIVQATINGVHAFTDKFEVVFEKAYFALKNKSPSVMMHIETKVITKSTDVVSWYPLDIPKNIKIIGNIYENKDLLNDTQELFQ